MKIVFINTNDAIGGAAIAAKRLRDVLLENGHELQLLVHERNDKNDRYTTEFNPTFWGKWKAKASFLLERLYFYCFEKSKKQRFSFSPLVCGSPIHTHELVQRADLVHLHWVNFGLVNPHQLKQLIHVPQPIVITLHDMWWITGGCHHSGSCESYQLICGDCETYLRNPSSIDLSFREFQQKRNIIQTKKNIAVVACSEWLAQRARKSSIMEDKRIVVIPNPLDTTIFKPLEQTELRKKYGLPSHKKYVVVAAAKLEISWKGVQQLIESIQIVQEKAIIPVEIIVIGQIEANTVEQFALPVHQLGLLDSPEKMAEAYNLGDVFVSSSLFENLPNTIMEALGCGIPCVGFKTGGIPEMIQHKQTGYLAEFKNTQDLAKGILWTLDRTETENIEIKQAARTFALRNYKKEVVAQKIEHLYRQLLLA
ncbi:MAG: glycosyltransferase [Spirosomataceae bacterium]